MKCFKGFIITLILLLFGLFPTSLALAVGGNTNINLQVESEAPPVCNNNGICGAGETSANCPSDCPVISAGGYSPDLTPPLIYNIKILERALTSAVIYWDTDEQAWCKVFWGQTMDYEKKVITGDKLALQHSIKFSDLTAATLYNFKISCKDRNNNESETKNKQFSTLSPLDIIPPANVSDFEAIPGAQKIKLQWKLPPDADLKEVKIFRSTVFYPSFPWDGTLVYLGKGEEFEDINLENGVKYYYTAFSYDAAGNYSSGAITSAVPQAPFVPLPPVQPPVGPPVGPPPPEVKKLRLEDFNFFQEERILSIIEGKIQLKEKEPLTVAIDYEKVPEVLKTIMVTLEKDQKYFSFLLRIDTKKTIYLATLLPPEPGEYPMTIHVLDYKNQTLKVLKGKIEVKSASKTLFIEEPPLPKGLKWLILMFLLGLLMFLLLKIRKRKRQKLVQKPKNVGQPILPGTYLPPWMEQK